MTATGPSEQQPPGPAEELPPPSSAVERANRLSAANMLRSLAPLVLICLAVVAWLAFLRQDVRSDPVREVDPSGSIRAAAEIAAFPLEAPAGLPEGWRATDTDFEGSGPGERVTFGIDYSTPSGDYALFLTSDDPQAGAVDAVLGGAGADGTADVGGREWTRSTTERGETALSRRDGDVVVLVTGDASDEELGTLAASVRPVD
ncbi:DUF4245 domain-containing protein [Trujillonella humicola]|uniref:DUF4245 domain-containing protein n=1 Tax=Trujillonella humicola TaxID=3383699 RepID=UPI003906A9A4